MDMFNWEFWDKIVWNIFENLLKYYLYEIKLVIGDSYREIDYF